MGLILSIETAISVCSVALHEEEGRMVAIAELFQENVHAQKVMPLIDTLLQQAGVRKNELCAVAVTSGLSSFSGVRFGVSPANGVAYALGIPVVGVDTWYARACRALTCGVVKELVVARAGVRRIEVHCTVFQCERE